MNSEEFKELIKALEGVRYEIKWGLVAIAGILALILIVLVFTCAIQIEGIRYDQLLDE